MVEVSNGQRPNIGNFCTYCFHPFQQINELNEINCEHCNTTIHDSDFINMVPEPIFKMLKETRKIERHYVISFAFFGIFLSLLSGFLMVLNISFLYKNEIFGTIILFTYLLISGRLLANYFGGFLGDQMGYNKARQKLNERWQEWTKIN
ncbi:MAG: hypothetical protein P8J51_01780 [Dehalococcoidia bacterium]|nr:hypothetical protein [Dehalococcoidia bacterium]